MMQKVAMMMKGMPGNVCRVRGYRPLNMMAAMRMQVASTEAEKENMAPSEIRSDQWQNYLKWYKQTSVFHLGFASELR